MRSGMTIPDTDFEVAEQHQELRRCSNGAPTITRQVVPENRQLRSFTETTSLHPACRNDDWIARKVLFVYTESSALICDRNRYNITP